MEFENKNRLIELAVNDFGSLIKKYRKENLLTLEDISSLIGCSSSYIFRIERNMRKPSIDFKVKVLTKVLNWSPQDIHAFLEKVIEKENLETED